MDEVTISSDTVKQALADFLASMEAQDVEGVLAAFADDYNDTQRTDKASLTDYFKALFGSGVLSGAKFSVEEVTIEEDLASATIKYETSAGTVFYKYDLKEKENALLIVTREQILEP